jgi:L-aspartate oxidase
VVFRATEIDAPQHCRARIEALRSLCWEVAGLERRGPVLGSALRRLAQEERQWLDRPLMRLCDGLETGDGIRLGSEASSALAATADLCHRLTVTRLLLEAALFREESRGGHHRSDAPARQPFWRRHTMQRRGHAIATAAADALAGPWPDRLRRGAPRDRPQKSSGPS